MSSIAANPAVQEKVVNFVLDKGGPVAGGGLCAAALGWVGLGVIRKSWDSALMGFTFFCLAVSATSIFWRTRKNGQNAVAAQAEQIVRDQNQENVSMVPEVQAAMAEAVKKVIT